MLLIQAHTDQLLQQNLTGGTHGILLTGPEGAGKLHIARHFASQKLGLDSREALETYPYFLLISPANGSISIEQIRALQHFLQLKTPGAEGIRRAVVIEDAHLMTGEGQNALLKVLEEPPADTLLVLTAPATLQLRETIYSRVQRIPVLPVSKSQALEHFGAQFPPAKVEKAYAMSGGNVGLLHALLHAEDHALVTQIAEAKALLAARMFERLARVDELGKQKDTIPLLLHACKLIASAALSQAAAKQQDKQVRHWHHALSAIYKAESALPRNPNPKLLLTDLMLQL